MRVKLAIAGCVALLVLLLAPHHASADADALWYIVSEQCVPDQQQLHSPKPCELVDLDAGYVVLKDRVGVTQFLVMPTARISRIESSEFLAVGGSNFWSLGFSAYPRRNTTSRVSHGASDTSTWCDPIGAHPWAIESPACWLA